MLPRDIPYPFDSMPEENYFGEFREPSNPIGPNAKKDKEKPKDKPEIENYDNAFDKFSIYPKV